MASLQGGRVVLESRPEASDSRTNRITEENWLRAEQAADEIICRVRPTLASEEKRKQIYSHIRQLLNNSLGVEVFLYGSKPLKTYLPHGDIDLTIFVRPNLIDALAADVKFVLEQESRNRTAEFVVKDVQLIGAEVNVVRCMVQDTSIDVSFNQIGGLCSLCFLEEVDRLIGKDHIFKRSILLVKSWCYYESRTHGASRGLLSTYALSILVLHIFQYFHAELNGPLAVLYKFLDFYGNFDWENYGISIYGPFRLSTLPAILVVMPWGGDRKLLINHDRLGSCLELFSVPATNNGVSHGFQPKYLNIVDPLKVVNNLGRSVSKGNMYRILGAFRYASKKLASVLLQSDRSISDELNKFFSSTIAKQGNVHVDMSVDRNTSISTVSLSPSNFVASNPRSDFHNLADLGANLSIYFQWLQYSRWFLHGLWPIQVQPPSTTSPNISYPRNSQENQASLNQNEMIVENECPESHNS